jgi:hypothetical protein
MAKYIIRKFNTNEGVRTDILDQESTPNIAIPFDEGNRHYQQYLEWVAEGNTAKETQIN